MRALIQRVRRASVNVDGEIIAEITQGLLVFLAVQADDDEMAADKLAHKIVHYRLFADIQDKMNLNVQQVQGALLVVSQFTLAADTQTGLRPSFSCAATPQKAQQLYEYFVKSTRALHSSVQTGRFAADMQVSLVNDGPVTFLLEV